MSLGESGMVICYIHVHYLVCDVHISSSFEEQSAYFHMAFLTGHVQCSPATGLYTHNEQ